MVTTAVDPDRLGDAGRAFDASFDELGLRCDTALRGIAAAVRRGGCSDAADELGAALRSLLEALGEQHRALGRGVALAGAAYATTEAHIAATIGMP